MNESDLLIKPGARSAQGILHDVTPASAGWKYVGFRLHNLGAGEHAAGDCRNGREALLVILRGKAKFAVDGTPMGEIGGRADVFEWTPPWSVYVPAGSVWDATATTGTDIAECTAPGRTGREAQTLNPNEISEVVRGSGNYLRKIHPILMDDRDLADSLLVTEVFTPSGHCSSYPPHKHDTDDFPRETQLEETYYHRINPKQGYGLHRIYTDDGSLDKTVAFRDGDVTLVPRGYHPVAAPHGYELYYLNIMAGPLRKWRFSNDPDHDWIVKMDEAKP